MPYDPPEDDVALTKLLRDNSSGPPGPGQLTTWDFTQDWPAAYVAGHVWPIVSGLLLDDDVDVRAHAVDFARRWKDGRALTRSRLFDVAEQRPELFMQADETGTTLRTQLATALSAVAKPADGPRLAQLLWPVVAGEPMDPDPATVLAEYAPERVIEHLRRWGEQAAAAARAAAWAIATFRRDELMDFLETMRGWSDARRREILQTVESAIIRDETKAALVGKALGLPAPKRPAPSTDEVRATLGL